MELSNDDLYEIEKILDIYAGMVNDTLNKYCQTSIHWEAVRKQQISPLAKQITDLKITADKVKEIRDKLQKIRNSK